MSSESIIELNYAVDLHFYYQKLCDLPGFTLLSSTDRRRGRYDILSAFPYDRIVLPYDAHQCSEILNTLRQVIVPKLSTSDIPFQGGAIGYVSYDLGSHLMGIASTPHPLLSSMPLLNLGLYDWAIVTDHYLKKTLLYSANQQQGTEDIVRYILNLWNSTSSAQRKFTVLEEFNALMSKEHYEYSFNEIKNFLKQGRSYQVNFTQPFKAVFQGDTWAMYNKISCDNPVPFSAFMRMENADILSFSPERFLLFEGGRLLTSPIKGTSRRSQNKLEDERLKSSLFYSAKNRAENVMIVDLLRNDLGKIAKTGSVKVLKLCDVQSYNSVHHLVSDIEATSKENIAPLDLFLSCFPGGSITGAPKLESMRIINELELYGRGVYCGSIVYFSAHGRFDSNIAIRTITASNHMLHLAAGGGIVIDSDCKEEYRECYIKINAIINALK